MKVLAILGSPRGKESTGYKLLQMIEDTSIELETIILSEMNIKESDGSGNEFYEGKTLFEDDMLIIERKLLESDAIILISPVYVHNVSSTMKKFIDRISYWTHLFRLVGKIGYVISVSSNNGNDIVNDYLQKVMEYMGIHIIGKTSIESEKLDDNQIILKSYANYITKKLVNFNINNEEFSIAQKANFKLFRDKYRKLGKGPEWLFWNENKYFEFNDFKELFLKYYNL